MINKLVLVVIFAVHLGACSHKPLKAPCEPGDAQPLSSFIASMWPDAFGALVSLAAECGPLRPL